VSWVASEEAELTGTTNTTEARWRTQNDPKVAADDDGAPRARNVRELCRGALLGEGSE
jgi:hypothetical protein